MHIVAIIFFLSLGALVVEGFRQALQPLKIYLTKSKIQKQKVSYFESYFGSLAK